MGAWVRPATQPLHRQDSSFVFATSIRTYDLLYGGYEGHHSAPNLCVLNYTFCCSVRSTYMSATKDASERAARKKRTTMNDILL